MPPKQQQIRITKTPEIQEALDLLHQEYPLLDDSELVKVTISQSVNKLKKPKTGKNVATFLKTFKTKKKSSGGYKDSYKEVYHKDLDKKYGY